jgi:hypothetical protein
MTPPPPDTEDELRSRLQHELSRHSPDSRLDLLRVFLGMARSEYWTVSRRVVGRRSHWVPSKRKLDLWTNGRLGPESGRRILALVVLAITLLTSGDVCGRDFPSVGWPAPARGTPVVPLDSSTGN